jgi:hypothetical protein
MSSDLLPSELDEPPPQAVSGASRSSVATEATATVPVRERVRGGRGEPGESEGLGELEESGELGEKRANGVRMAPA